MLFSAAYTNLEADSISKQTSEPQCFWQRNNFNKIRVRTSKEDFQLNYLSFHYLAYYIFKVVVFNSWSFQDTKYIITNINAKTACHF